MRRNQSIEIIPEEDLSNTITIQVYIKDKCGILYPKPAEYKFFLSVQGTFPG